MADHEEDALRHDRERRHSDVTIEPRRGQEVRLQRSLLSRPASEIIRAPDFAFHLHDQDAALFESAFLLGYLAALHVPPSDNEENERAHASLYAEIRFLRTQLAMFLSRGARPRVATPLERIQLVFYSLFFEWKEALVVVKPDTLVRWHRNLTALNWAFISKVFDRNRRTGRPPIPKNLRDLIARLAAENRVWSPRDIAENLKEKFGIVVSHRSVAKYLRLARHGNPDYPRRGQSWSTFIRNHLGSTVACDFAVVSTLAFKRLYILVILELGSRRLLHINATAHPTAAWTMQQFREAIPSDHSYEFLVHDRDAIFSAGFDASIRAIGINPVLTPPQAPQANGFCERLIGTMRRGCLDHIIPVSERHLRGKLLEWKDYYNHSRPHMSLEGHPPDPPDGSPAPEQPDRHSLSPHAKIICRPFLGGLHHDYRLVA